jgi:hypothetical protein
MTTGASAPLELVAVLLSLILSGPLGSNL